MRQNLENFGMADAYVAREKAVSMYQKGIITETELQKILDGIHTVAKEDARQTDTDKSKSNEYDPTADKVTGEIMRVNGQVLAISSYNGHAPRMTVVVEQVNGRKSKGKMGLDVLDFIRKMDDKTYTSFIGTGRAIQSTLERNVKTETRNAKQQIPAQVMAPRTDTDAKVEALEGKMAEMAASIAMIAAALAPKAKRVKSAE